LAKKKSEITFLKVAGAAGEGAEELEEEPPKETVASFGELSAAFGLANLGSKAGTLALRFLFSRSGFCSLESIVPTLALGTNGCRKNDGT
jgi:hypothetical protein